MRPLLSIVTIVFLAGSCTTQNGHAIHARHKFDTLPLPLDSNTFYFKTKTNWEDTTKDALHTFVNAWYSRMLFALREPVISEYNGDKEVYRFTWLRTFHHPVSIRLEKQGNTIKLFTKVCKGAGGYEPGIMAFDTTIDITTDQYNQLLQKIDDTDFWNLVTEKRDEIGHDGSEWIIEVIKDNKYHMVTRWTPGKGTCGNFRIIGEYLISLSKLSEDETKYPY